ncbi:MAG: hypothetical protein IPP90_07210 [Gemmatimonadaceae bacterium]|nr:hypothetical protein [Gemmatimonadaceae bacterium]
MISAPTVQRALLVSLLATWAMSTSATTANAQAATDLQAEVDVGGGEHGGDERTEDQAAKGEFLGF